MSEANLTITIRIAWRAPLFLRGCIFFARTFGVEPNIDRIGDFLRRYAFKVVVR